MPETPEERTTIEALKTTSPHMAAQELTIRHYPKGMMPQNLMTRILERSDMAKTSGY